MAKKSKTRGVKGVTASVPAEPESTNAMQISPCIRGTARVHVFGPPCSGKSTFAESLAKWLGVEHIDLDLIATSEGVTSDLQPALAWQDRVDYVQRISERDGGWVTEGTYLGWTDLLFEAADLVVWLDIRRGAAWRRAARRHISERCSGPNGGYSPAKTVQFARHPGARQFITFGRHISRYYGERANEKIPRSEQFGRAVAAEKVRPISHKLLHIKSGPGIRDVTRAAERVARAANKQTEASHTPAAYSQYARLHQTSDTPVHYDGSIYSPTGFDQHVWDIQKSILDRQLNSPEWLAKASYLDFATGTGRILAHFHDKVADAAAVDTSPQMLDAARAKAPDARLLCLDILEPNALSDESFNLITAFRFFLNTEPELRQPILNRLVGLLKDEDSLVIFNVHATRRSVLGLMEPLRRLKGWPPLNFMSEREVRQLCDDAGLEIVISRGVGLFPPRLFRSRMGPALRRIDRFASDRRLLKAVSQDLLFVCRKRSTAQTV